MAERLKHSQGPWACAAWDLHPEIATVAVVGDWVVGIPTPGYPGGNYDAEYGTDEADAHLIAAAPELLAALEELVSALHPATLSAIDRAVAAIAKAWGES